ncbi:MAG TPA: hypothetical protein VMM14_07180 [Acidimicrobiia bacterium]|nr:hypothetical protein [Acidimicrobiia bacterium]
MTTCRTVTPTPGAVAGAALAVLIGLIAMPLAPDDGFADLAAATVSLVFGVPAGAILGGVGGYLVGRRGRSVSAR